MMAVATPEGAAVEGADPVADYKRILQGYIDLRPSGMRLRIAEALGKHRSFVSQITNPAYAVPVPALHLETIFRICHFSPEERETFLLAYRRAHPTKRAAAAAPARPRARRSIQIEIPASGDLELDREIEAAFRQLADHIGRMVRRMPPATGVGKPRAESAPESASAKEQPSDRRRKKGP